MMKKILIILMFITGTLTVSAQVVTVGQTGSQFRTSINNYFQNLSDSLTTLYTYRYSLNPSDHLEINLGEDEYFIVENTYGIPPINTTFYLQEDSISMEIDNNVKSFRQIMTDTDFDLLYDDGDVFTGGGGIRIDTNMVALSFGGTGLPATSSRLAIEYDSSALYTFNGTFLTTHKIATSGNGVYLSSDSIFLPSLADDTVRLLTLNATGSIGTATIQSGGLALDSPLPDVDELLSDREDGEIKWPHIINGELVWGYNISIDDPGKIFGELQGGIETAYRLNQQRKMEIERLEAKVESLNNLVMKLAIGIGLLALIILIFGLCQIKR